MLRFFMKPERLEDLVDSSSPEELEGDEAAQVLEEAGGN